MRDLEASKGFGHDIEGNCRARRLFPRLAQAFQRPIRAGSDQCLELLFLFGFDLGRASSAGSVSKRCVFLEASFEALYAGDGESEAVSDLPLGLSAGTGIENALSQVQGVSAHVERVPGPDETSMSNLKAIGGFCRTATVAVRSC
jgi:hypothetical protein